MSVHRQEISYSPFFGTNAKTFEVTRPWKKTLRSRNEGKVSVEVRPAVASGEPSISVATIEEERIPIEGSGGYLYQRTEQTAAVYVGDEINRLGFFTRGWRGRRLIAFSYNGPQKSLR